MRLPFRHTGTGGLFSPRKPTSPDPPGKAQFLQGNANAAVAVLTAKDKAGVYYVEHVLKMFANPHSVEKSMRTCAEADGPDTIFAYMQDPGSAGVAEAQATARALDGFNVRFATGSGDKETRAKPVSAQCEAGNVKIVRGLWNDEFLRELENFPAAKHDDAVDALSGTYEIVGGRAAAFESERVQIPRRTRMYGDLNTLSASRDNWLTRGLWY